MKKDDIQRIIEEVLGAHPLRKDVRKISLFGSQLDETQRPDSDIDFVIDCTDAVGLFEMVQLQQDLEKRFGMRVDLVTPEGLSPYIKQKVLSTAVTVYER